MSLMRMCANDWDELLDVHEVVGAAAAEAGAHLSSPADALPLVVGDGQALRNALRRRLRQLITSHPPRSHAVELRGEVARDDPGRLSVELRLGPRRCTLALPIAGAYVLA